MAVALYLDTLLLLMVTAAAVKDLESRRIPNRLLAAGMLGALVLHLLSVQPLTGLLAWLGGAAAGLAIFLPFYLVRGMAAGDVKMMAAVGAFAGPGDALRIAILAWCVGGVMALAVIVFKGRLRMAVANMWAILRPMLLRLPRAPERAAGAGGQPSAGAIPYGVAIAAGTIALLVGRYAERPLL
ncbi:prepilin peptidase [Massilia sp. HP4]|uniref:A24 family peptidase n=1 Tax=Massilia sp. HP4 TaxID=2562316 RepID=UPI0010BFA714|nr:prepilin peptidase [Massilia sp. HP4]